MCTELTFTLKSLELGCFHTERSIDSIIRNSTCSLFISRVPALTECCTEVKIRHRLCLQLYSLKGKDAQGWASRERR